MSDLDTDQLLLRFEQGDTSARDQLLRRHRQRLLRMVEVRMDANLVSRVDPSDVVQDALIEAVDRLAEYARCRPIPFYPWLRKIALERLIDLHRAHVKAQRRSVDREEPWEGGLSDQSVAHLADQLIGKQSPASAQLIRREMHQRVRKALDRLPQWDREIIVLRFLEQLSIGEIAAALEISETAAKSRHRRALQRIRLILGDLGE